MYPYFAANPTFITPPAAQYGYSQSNGYMQPQYTTPQAINSIQSMYTTVQPYMSKEFLIATFGNKPEYIQIFLTLPHQDKLKMYLLMEEKKIYGQMSDKEGYHKILKEIAQKMQNYNNFHQIKVQQVDDSNEKKKKDLQSKIDSFCQTSFQKMHISHLGENKATAAQKKKYVELEDTDQWIQSTVVQEETDKNSMNNKDLSNSERIESYNIESPLESNKQNLVIASSHSGNQAPVIFNMFNFDSEMERAMTKEIGLKDAQKLSIWEMELSETEVKNNEPKLSEVFKKKDSVMEIPQPTPQIPEKNSQQASFDIFASYPAYQTAQYVESNHNDTNASQQYNGFTDYSLFNPIYSMPQANANNIPLDFMNQPINIEVQQDAKVQDYQNQQLDNAQARQQQEQQWTQEVQYETATQQTYSMPIAETYPQQPHQMNIYSITQQPRPIELTQSSQQFDNLFDFQVIESKVEVQLINHQTASLFLSSQGQTKEEVPEIEMHQYYHIQLPEIPQEIIQTVVDLDVQPNSFMNSQLYLPESDKKYELIDSLKIQFSQSQRLLLKKQLKNKSFQCNAQFYLVILNHLRQVGLESTNQFQHFTEQYKIAKEILELTAMYTAVVDEEDEEKVETALRKTKALYNQIYNKSTISQKFVQHLLSDKNKQKGIYYKFGKVLIDSCINTELITRASSQQNHENIFNSFCLLFILEKNNSLNKLKNWTEIIIGFTNQQIDRYKSFNEQLFRQVEDKLDESNSLLLYIKGLLKMVSICERMINLMKCCSIKSTSNLVKTLKNCKQIKNRFGRYQSDINAELFPSQYARLLTSCVQKNYTLYDIHLKYSELAEKLPLCQICLLAINNQGGQQEEKGWYHYSCFNLIKAINGLDYL